METKKRLVKGSDEAKQHMAFLRSKRGSKKTAPSEDNNDVPKQEPKPKSKNISVDL